LDGESVEEEMYSCATWKVLSEELLSNTYTSASGKKTEIPSKTSGNAIASLKQGIPIAILLPLYITIIKKQGTFLFL